MKRFNKKSQLAMQLGASLLLGAIFVAGAWAQDTSTSTIKHGPSSYDTKVKNAEVVYVEGNDLVLRVENGRLEHLVVPDSDVFNIDGQNLTVHDLKPGTKLTQTITTTTTPRYVTTVRTIKGKVWHVTPPTSLIVSLPEGGNQAFTVPRDAKFTIHGEPKTVFDLRKGMNIEATVITDSQETVMSSAKSMSGVAPVPAPREVGVLLILPPPRGIVTMESRIHPPEMAETLPSTASLLPLAGLLGSLAVVSALGLTALRRSIDVR